jgi:hypothetical protein
MTQKGLKNLFRKYNLKYFGGELPTPELYLVPRLNDEGKPLCGSTTKVDEKFMIEISTGMLVCLEKLTLIHEMTHMKLWPNTSHRTKAWRKEIDRIASMGFLREIF